MGKARPKVVVLGSLCRNPVAGITWQGIHFLCGLQRLGFDAYYVEWHGHWVADPSQPWVSRGAPGVAIADVMRRFGFEDRWICQSIDEDGEDIYGGFGVDGLTSLYARAQAIINLSGAHVLDPAHMECPRRVYLETDPGIPQIRLHSGDQKTTALVDGHTHHFTWAENIHQADCRLPGTHLQYGTSRQPIVLDFWRESEESSEHRTFTTVARWKKHKAKRIEFAGEVYHWDKDREFRKYLDLPGRSGEEFELALAQVSPADRADLVSAGWGVVDAVVVSGAMETYRTYIQSSRGEFTVAKDQYTALRTGWFADRSACYLAAGRPVVAQDTGYSAHLPTGEGLFAFTCMDDVLAAVDAINRDYRRHARAATELAREYFDSDRVLGDLLEEIGVEHPAAGRHSR